MGKLVVSLDGVVLKEVVISKDKTTLGRRPYNDIVIDNLAVSGEHAAVHLVGPDCFIEDLNSTNGTYINGKAIKRQQLVHNDTVEVGKYKIRFLDAEQGALDRTVVLPAGESPSAQALAPTRFDSGMGTFSEAPEGKLSVLSGSAAGREMPLTKDVTTLGKPGVQVACVVRKPGGFVLRHVEGASRPRVNGAPMVSDEVPLRDGDVFELGSAQLKFARL